MRDDEGEVHGSRQNNDMRGQKDQVDRQDRRQAKTHCQGCVFERRPRREAHRAKRVNQPADHPEHDQPIGSIVLWLVQQSTNIPPGDDESDAGKRHEDEYERVARRQDTTSDGVDQNTQQRLGGRHDRGRQRPLAASQLLTKKHKEAETGEADRAQEPGKHDRLSV